MNFNVFRKNAKRFSPSGEVTKMLPRWRKLALQEMGKILKPLGFKKTGTTFRLCQESAWMIVNLQSSSHNTEDGPLTVYGNIGLYYRVGEDELENPAVGPFECESHWRARVRPNQQSFDIVSDEEAQEVGSMIATEGLQILKQVLKRYPTPVSMLDAHKSNPLSDEGPKGWCATGLLSRQLGIPLPTQPDHLT